MLGLKAGGAADFRRAGARRIGRIDKVDVKAAVGWPVADDVAGLGHDVVRATGEQFFYFDDGDTVGAAKFDVFTVVHGATNADLNHPFGIQQPLFDGAAERRAVGVFEAAEIAVEQIGVGVKVDHAKGGIFGKGAQDRQGNQVITADAHGGNVMGGEVFIKGGDAVQAVLQIGGVWGNVAKISTVGLRERINARGGIDTPDHGGIVAHLAWAVARAGAVCGARIPRHADQAKINVFVPFVTGRKMWQAHEAGHPGKAGQVHAGNRLEKRIGGVGHRGSRECGVCYC